MDQKVSALTSLPAIDRANDLLYIVDVSGGTSNRTTPNFMLGITGAPVGTTDTQTLTNKTITSPTISSPVLSGTITGTYTFGGTPTFPASVVTLTGSQTLTNKTLTSPTINTPTISNASITANAISGFTTSNSGTVYGVSIVLGVIQSAALVGQVNTAAIQNGAVGAAQLSTSAITLGYAQINSNFVTTSTAAVQVTGLTTTVTIPSGSRRIEITVCAPVLNASANVPVITIWDGPVATGTQLQAFNGVSGAFNGVVVMAIVSPAAGSKTYNVGVNLSGAGTLTFGAGATSPGFILVKAI